MPRVKFKESYLPPPEFPEFFCNIGECEALADSNNWSKVLPAVGAAEGSVAGVIPQVLQAAQAHAVAAGQLPRVLKDLLAHGAGQRGLQLLLQNLHSGLRTQSAARPSPLETADEPLGKGKR